MDVQQNSLFNDVCASLLSFVGQAQDGVSLSPIGIIAFGVAGIIALFGVATLLKCLGPRRSRSLDVEGLRDDPSVNDAEVSGAPASRVPSASHVIEAAASAGLATPPTGKDQPVPSQSVPSAERARHNGAGHRARATPAADRPGVQSSTPRGGATATSTSPRRAKRTALPSAGARIAKAQVLARRGQFDKARTELTTGLRDTHGAMSRTATAGAGEQSGLAIAELHLALAEIEATSGDLTSACEHWRMAREGFAALQDRNREALAADRMETMRCPTDWVLTDF